MSNYRISKAFPKRHYKAITSFNCKTELLTSSIILSNPSHDDYQQMVTNLLPLLSLLAHP